METELVELDLFISQDLPGRQFSNQRKQNPRRKMRLDSLVEEVGIGAAGRYDTEWI